MTRDDVLNFARVLHSLEGCVPNENGTHRPFTRDEFDRLIDRALWALRAGNSFPRFSDAGFRAAVKDLSETEKMFKED